MNQNMEIISLKLIAFVLSKLCVCVFFVFGVLCKYIRVSFLAFLFVSGEKRCVFATLFGLDAK